jgi:geranylgeranyl pyrophosphate synthase
MTPFSLALDYLASLGSIAQWPLMQDMAQAFFASTPRNCYLPVAVCRAVGGSEEDAVPATAAIGCLQIAIVIIDDMLDGEATGFHRQIGEAAAANLASAFQAAGLEAILSSSAGQQTKAALLENLNRMVSTTALGQYWDVQNPDTENGYWAVARAKSAPFFGSAFLAGALLGQANPETAACMERLGRIYGILIQLHDDANDALAVPADADWLSGRQSLPLLYALHTDHPDRERFVALRHQVVNETVLTEAQEILIRSGAISYVIYQLLEYHQEASQLLRSLSLPPGNEIERLFGDIIRPVEALLAMVKER